MPASPRRRFVLAAALCLVLGALTTVLLTWSLRAYYQWGKAPPSPQPYSIAEGDQHWEASVFRALGRFAVVYQEAPPPGSGWQRARLQGEPDPIPFPDEPAWAAAARHANPGLFTLGGYGFPCCCLMYMGVRPPNTPKMQDLGLFITPSWLGPAAGLRLPLRPIWGGMAADTAIFGAGWWVLFLGAGSLRRRFRRRGGHCPACDYDLAGNTTGLCPECGSNAPPPASSPPAPAPSARPHPSTPA